MIRNRPLIGDFFPLNEQRLFLILANARLIQHYRVPSWPAENIVNFSAEPAHDETFTAPCFKATHAVQKNVGCVLINNGRFLLLTTIFPHMTCAARHLALPPMNLSAISLASGQLRARLFNCDADDLPVSTF